MTVQHEFKSHVQTARSVEKAISLSAPVRFWFWDLLVDVFAWSEYERKYDYIYVLLKFGIICSPLGGRDDVQHGPSCLSATGQGASGKHLWRANDVQPSSRRDPATLRQWGQPGLWTPAERTGFLWRGESVRGAGLKRSFMENYNEFFHYKWNKCIQVSREIRWASIYFTSSQQQNIMSLSQFKFQTC